MKRIKNIALTEECIKVLSIMAIENGMVFKTYVEKLLEEIAAKNKTKK